MYSNTYNNENFMRARSFIENSEFKKAYDFLKTLTDKCAEWYYLTGFSAMNIGYYEEGEDFLKEQNLWSLKIVNIVMHLEVIHNIEMIIAIGLTIIIEEDVMI